MRASRLAWLRSRLSQAHPGTQLAALTLPIIVLLTAAAIGFAWRGYVRSVSTADRETQLMASAAALDAERFLGNRIEILESISVAPVLATGDLTQIHSYLSSVVALSGFSEIGWIDTQGYALTVGGAAPLSTPLYAGDRPHIAAALRTRRPVVGQAQISRVSQQPTVNVVVPVVRQDRLVALIAGAVRLNGPKVTDLQFGNVTGLRVIDGNGNLAVVGEERGLSELRSVQAWPAYARVREAPEGVLRASSGLLGDSDRVIGFAAVNGSDGWIVVVDRPADEVYEAAQRTFRAEVVIAVLFAAGSLLLVGWAAVRLEASAQRFVLFIDALTHDIGTPLTVIRAYTTRLARALRDEPSLLNSVVEVDRAGRRIERMIQSLADLLGPEQRPDLARTEIDLVALVRDLVNEYELRTNRTITYRPQATTMIGEWDGLRVERLVDNLLSNAIKYSPADAEVVVELQSERGRDPGAERVVVLRVRDFGIGIPVSEQQTVWRRFQRGSNTGGVPGKGVGLASVRQIAEEHRGTVTILSSEGQGTLVTVRLPWPEDQAPGLEEEQAHVPTPPAGRSSDV